MSSSGMRSIPKDFRKAIQPLIKAGWEYVQPTKMGHARIVAPDGERYITLAGSPGSWGALKSLQQRVRRALAGKDAIR